MDPNRWPRIRRRSLVGLIALIVAAAGWPVLAPTAQDQAQNQSLDEIFTRVSPTVVVVRSKGRDVGPGASLTSPRRGPGSWSGATAG